MVRWDADVAVVGLGAWGSSALWQLASRGRDVLGIERFHPGNSFGSSHGGSRMFRITCLEHPGLVPLARRSLELWQKLESAAGTRLFFQSGGLLIGPPDGHVAGGTLRAARAHGIAVDVLTAAELRARFPRHAGVPDDHVGVWEPSAGILHPEAAIRAATDLAVRAGARTLTDTRVTAVELVDGGAVLRTVKDLRVRQVVVTVGSWLAKLVPRLPLETVRMPITWFRPMLTGGEFDLPSFPVFMRETADGTVLWGNGRENGHEVKLGLEVPPESGPVQPVFDPDGDRSVTSADWLELARMVPAHLPGLHETPARVAVCMLTRTPDGQFVVGRPGGDPRIVVAGGCNAHGFKHASGIGEALADVVDGAPTRCQLDFLAPDRF